MSDLEQITQIGLVPAELINDLRQIIDSARSRVAATANYELTMMYWHIGNRINRDVLNNERAEYGQQIVSQVATQLQGEYETQGYFDTHFGSIAGHKLIMPIEHTPNRDYLAYHRDRIYKGA